MNKQLHVWMGAIKFEYAPQLSNYLSEIFERRAAEIADIKLENPIIMYVRIFEFDTLCSPRILVETPKELIPFIESCVEEATKTFKV